jgi:tetratricopeptide (TPR) repeat protein
MAGAHFGLFKRKAMISEQTVESARQWHEIGVAWLNKGATNLALSHLERAISVFEEIEDLPALTQARRDYLTGLLKLNRHEEVEARCDEAMRGYIELDDAAGQARLLALLAESVAHMGRLERARVHLNLAAAIAELRGERTLLRSILEQQARLLLQRESIEPAVQLLKRAEAIAEQENEEGEIARYREERAKALLHLGERPEAIALLEDAQSRYLRKGMVRQAVEPLQTLRELYERNGLSEDRNRIGALIHLCGQRLIRENSAPIAGESPRTARPNRRPNR